MGSSFVSLPAKRSLYSILYSSEETRMSDPNPYFANGSSTPSSKRPKPPSTPPLNVPPGHVAFRLLCHASRIGGVIGKSGSVIKQLQQTTGAKIRIEDALPDSPDRVVVVVAQSALAARVSLRSPIGNVNGRAGDNDGEGGDMEVSKAQEALLRVFDRILEVAAESGAVGIGIGVGVVSCRLLAEAQQVGSVIGKGGKVVEKIRKDSGCKIRVLTDKLPACAASTDEMIEIEGDVLAVKKALVAVSRCLQDSAPVDKMRMLGSRPLEAVSHETLPDLHVEQLSQRNSLLPTFPSSSIPFPSSSISYVSGVRPLSLESDRVSTLDAKNQQQEVVFKILCPNDRVGGVIGKGGAIVRALQNETGAIISVGATLAESEERLITITASESPESRYSPAQKAAVLVFSRSVEAGIEKGQESGSNRGLSVTARAVVPSNQVGCLLGKGGAIISEMRKATGASIRIIGGDQASKCISENEDVVQISGDFSSVQDALYNVTGRLRDNLFSSTQNSTGTMNSSSLLPTGPYGRMRDSAPLGIQTSPPVDVTHGVRRHTTLTQSMDHLGLSHTYDRPPSPPRSWTSQAASQMINGVSTRGITDSGRGLMGITDSSRGLMGITDSNRGLTNLRGGLELGSGSKSAIVTNTTVEIIVPENVIGSVYGENGNNLARLRQISGAKVIVHEPRPGSSDRIVVISGTPDETQAAQSLLHAFILTGPS